MTSRLANNLLLALVSTIGNTLVNVSEIRLPLSVMQNLCHGGKLLCLSNQVNVKT